MSDPSGRTLFINKNAALRAARKLLLRAAIITNRPAAARRLARLVDAEMDPAHYNGNEMDCAAICVVFIHLRKRIDRLDVMRSLFRDQLDAWSMCMRGAFIAARCIQIASHTLDKRLASRISDLHLEGLPCITFDAYDAILRGAPGAVGCRASHTAAHTIAAAASRIAQTMLGIDLHFLFLEDDATVFRHAPPRALASIFWDIIHADALHADDISAVHLGPNAALRCAPGSFRSPSFAKAVLLESSMNAHAYILRCDAIQSIATSLWDESIMRWAIHNSPLTLSTFVPFDIAWEKSMRASRWAGISPPIIMQAAGFSDIEQCDKKSQHALCKAAVYKLRPS